MNDVAAGKIAEKITNPITRNLICRFIDANNHLNADVAAVIKDHAMRKIGDLQLQMFLRFAIDETEHLHKDTLASYSKLIITEIGMK